jgi:creatinine amidohydrolase
MNRILIMLTAACLTLIGRASPAQTPDSAKLENRTHADVKSMEVQVLVLPIGSTEPHGYHLPYGNDFFTVGALAARTAAKANEQGAKVLVLPTMPYGVNVNLASLPRAQSIRPATMMQFVKDVVDTAERQGIRKVVIFNGHGGNRTTLGASLRELFDSHRKVFVAQIEPFTDYMGLLPKGVFGGQGAGHGGEAETSVALALYPEKVRMDKAVAPRMGKTKLQTGAAARATWVSPWEQVSDTTASDPAGAAAEKGQKMIDVFVEQVAKFLVELSNAEMTESFPY